MYWLIILPCSEVQVLPSPLHAFYISLITFVSPFLRKNAFLRQSFAVDLDRSDGDDFSLPTKNTGFNGRIPIICVADMAHVMITIILSQFVDWEESGTHSIPFFVDS